jgi:predicted nucleic-acid-binding protein
MIALDTTILARFYCDDPDDRVGQRQRVIARRILESHNALYVPLSVVLELEWVLRGFYEQRPAAVCAVLAHLLGLPNVHVEAWERVRDAIDAHQAGLDFADALHLACSGHCEQMLTFDDRRFARRAIKQGLNPPVAVPV